MATLAGCLGEKEGSEMFLLPSEVRYALEASDELPKDTILVLRTTLNGSSIGVEGRLLGVEGAHDLLMSLDASTGRWIEAQQDDYTWWATPWSSQAPPHEAWYLTQAATDMRPLLPLGLQWPLLAHGLGSHSGEAGSLSWRGSVGATTWTLDAEIQCRWNCVQSFDTGPVKVSMEGGRSVLPEQIHLAQGQRWSVNLTLIDVASSHENVVPALAEPPSLPAGDCDGRFPCPVPPDYRRNFQAGDEALKSSNEWQMYIDRHPEARLLRGGVGGPSYTSNAILGQEVLNVTHFSWLFVYGAGTTDSVMAFALQAREDLQGGWGDPIVTSARQEPEYPEIFSGADVPPAAAAWPAVKASMASIGFALDNASTWGVTHSTQQVSPDPYQRHYLTALLGEGVVTLSFETGALVRWRT